jgi:hypothetical protein
MSILIDVEQGYLVALAGQGLCQFLLVGAPQVTARADQDYGVRFHGVTETFVPVTSHDHLRGYGNGTHTGKVDQLLDQVGMD